MVRFFFFFFLVDPRQVRKRGILMRRVNCEIPTRNFSFWKVKSATCAAKSEFEHFPKSPTGVDQAALDMPAKNSGDRRAAMSFRFRLRGHPSR